MSDAFLKLLPSTIEHEKILLSYLYKNEDEIIKYNEDYFFDKDYKILFKSFAKLKKSGLNLDNHLVLTQCRNQSTLFSDKVFIDIKETDINSIATIDYSTEQLENSSIKYRVLNNIENIVNITSDKKEFSKEKLKEEFNNLASVVFKASKNKLLDSNDLVKDYIEIMRCRKDKKELDASLGFEVLDNLITKPGAPEEMTGLIANKGGGKSIFAKCLELELLKKKICVLSINLEMSEESCLDRRMCLETGYPLKEIIKLSNITIEEDLRKELEKFKDDPYYLFYKEPELDLKGLDLLIYEAKEIFKRKKVLPENEYIFVVIDLLDMVDEFGGSDNSYKIKKALNTLHKITRNHGVHLLLLIQANENKFRGGNLIKKPEDLDYYKVGLEDIEGSAAYSQRCRVIVTLTRPLQLKKRFFPELMELWDLETDIINCNIVKQNDGAEGFLKFVFGNNFHIYPYKE